MLQIQFLHKSDLDELCKQEKKKNPNKASSVFHF